MALSNNPAGGWLIMGGAMIDDLDGERQEPA
jgi:hypothetical protein